MSYRDNAQPVKIVSGSFGTQVVTLDLMGFGQGADQPCREAQIWTPNAVAMFEATPAGPDLVTNGDFVNWTADDPDDWTVSGEAGAVEITENPTGSCQMITAGDSISIIQGILVSGKAYKVSVTMEEVQAGALRVILGSLENIGSTNSLGEIDFYGIADGTNLELKRNGGATDLTFSKVVVREVNVIVVDKVLRMPVSNTNKLLFGGGDGDVANILWRS